MSGFPAPVVFLADHDLSYTDSSGEPVIECHFESLAEAAGTTWRVVRLIAGYLKYIAELP